jgi:predicted RecA/RadA family phage recombinase
MALNQLHEKGSPVTLTWSTVSPTSGDPVCKTQAKATGGITGVALTGDTTVSKNVEVATEGVFDVPITAGGAMKVGDYVYASIPATVETCTTVLSETNTGLLFGQLLEEITGAGTVTRKVKLLQPAHL